MSTQSVVDDACAVEAPFEQEGCPLRDVLDRVGDKWSVLVVLSLSEGTHRFGALRRRIDGISQRMLTTTLRQLERDGLVQRTLYPEVPLRVEYALTELGTTLITPLFGLAAWAQQHRSAVSAARVMYDQAHPATDDRITA